MFGVDDDARIVGIETFSKARDRLAGIVAPRLAVDVDAYETSDGLVVGVAVPRGDNAPYAGGVTDPRNYVGRALPLRHSPDVRGCRRPIVQSGP